VIAMPEKSPLVECLLNGSMHHPGDASGKTRDD